MRVARVAGRSLSSELRGEGREFVGGLVDSGERGVAAEDFQGFEKRRGVLASTDGDADGLKHLPSFDAEFLSGSAQNLVERIVLEFGVGENLFGFLENVGGHGGVAFLRNKLGGIIRRESIDEKEVGGGEDVAEKFDALANERRDTEHFGGVDVVSRLANDGQKLSG
jgi:hypothetical protein